jgi:outer membrane lipoprotein-sorting protein
MFLSLAIAATALAQDAPKPADEPRPDPAKQFEDLLSDLSKRLGSVKTLRSRFEQRKYLAVFEDVVTSEGTLALAVPDKLRWEYAKPVKSVLTVNGRMAQRERTSRKGVTTKRSYALDDEPITSITAQQVFLWTRGDFAKARKTYDLALVTERPTVVRATPKDERLKKVVVSIDLTFSEDRRILTGVTFVEKGGARTLISFRGAEIDPELPEALFQIEK